MSNRIDITGHRFGHLIAIKISGTRTNDRLSWECRCDCGVLKIVTGKELRSGNSVSCGCWRRENFVKRLLKHGARRHDDTMPEYHVWISMRDRCENPGNHAFKYYGARGIRVCDQWLNSFENFLADIGPRPPGRQGRRAMYSIDRIDNDGNYEPGNLPLGNVGAASSQQAERLDKAAAKSDALTCNAADQYCLLDRDARLYHRVGGAVQLFASSASNVSRRSADAEISRKTP
jgi:hypothetical protein